MVEVTRQSSGDDMVSDKQQNKFFFIYFQFRGVEINHFERIYHTEGKNKNENCPNRLIKISSQFLKWNLKEYSCSTVH